MNIYFSNHRGRLGNIIYLFACFYYCLKRYPQHNVFFEMQNVDLDYYNRNTNLYNFLLPYNFNVNNFTYDVKIDETDLKNNMHVDEVITKYNNMNIYFDDTFFQESRYFNEYKHALKNIIYTYSDKQNKYLDLISKYGVDNCLLISVRHGEDYSKSNFYVISKQYYIDMYNKYFNNIDNIFITTDNIEWCKNNLNEINDKNVIYIDDLLPIEIITLCYNFKNYICSNSSFSACCELLSNYDYHRAIAPYNLFKFVDRPFMFSSNSILIDLKQHISYIENKERLNMINML